MVAPVAKGIIVATTLLLAAGLAAYENEQIRAWIETQRRKIAIVLTGSDGSSTSTSEKEREREAEGLAFELRDEVIRRHREEIIERARKEGVAVDLDELDAVEKLYEEQRERAAAASTPERRRSAQSFDELVGSDGMLRDRDITSGFASGVASDSHSTVRQRGLSGMARGAYFANPFDDEAQFLFDQELIGAGGEELAGISRSANTSKTISEEPTLENLVDVHETPYKSDAELEAEIDEAIRRSLEEVSEEGPLITTSEDGPEVRDLLQAESTMLGAASESPSMQNSIYQSYYYGGLPSSSEPANEQSQPSTVEASTASFHSAVDPFRDSPEASTTFYIPSPATLQPSSARQTPAHSHEQELEDSDDALTPAGTLTPTTEAGFSLSDDGEDRDSLYGEPSVNFGDLLGSRLNEQQQQRGSAQAHEVEDDSDEFSVVGGVETPGSWTDVESVDGFSEVDHEEEDERRRRETTSSTLQ